MASYLLKSMSSFSDIVDWLITPRDDIKIDDADISVVMIQSFIKQFIIAISVFAICKLNNSFIV